MQQRKAGFYVLFASLEEVCWMLLSDFKAGLGVDSCWSKDRQAGIGDHNKGTGLIRAPGTCGI